MHGLIRERLEELLGSTPMQSEVKEHLANCPECAAELEAMRGQARTLKTFRVSEDLEPAPGFYARVIQRIEEGTVYSIWTVFTDGPFGKWLAYGSLAVALVLGTWVVSTERADGHLGAPPVVAKKVINESPMPVTGNEAHQRDVVLVNFASYSQPPTQ
jgi:hypothetical protein